MIGRCVAGFVVLLVAAGAVGQSMVTAAENRRFPPPGVLVDIGGYRLHLYCIGEGSPTVILESGTGDGALVWSWVQPEVAKQSRVCAYDRAGYGWSDAGPKPRTSDREVSELRTLLGKAGIRPPYVLAGHSFGGMNMQLYARRYPDEVAGLVLVDAVHEDQWSRLPPAALQFIQGVNRQQAVAAYLAPLGLLRLMGITAAPSHLPDDVKSAAEAMGAHNKVWATLHEEAAGLPESGAELKAAPPLHRDLPLAVLGASIQQIPGTEEVWPTLQQDLASRSDRSTFTLVPDADHYIHTNQPQAVIDAINQVSESARNN